VEKIGRPQGLAPILSPHEVGERWLGEAETERGILRLYSTSALAMFNGS
jgi:hypothetical protein